MHGQTSRIKEVSESYRIMFKEKKGGGGTTDHIPIFLERKEKH
jgi:hypothetical protein